MGRSGPTLLIPLGSFLMLLVRKLGTLPETFNAQSRATVRYDAAARLEL